MRRQRWLARIHALELVSAIGEALSSDTARRSPAQAGRFREVPAAALLARMGAGWQ